MAFPFTPADLQACLAQGMGASLHWFPQDVPVGRLAATLVGMANGTGGTVLIGIAPRSRELLGVQDPALAVDRLFQAALLSEPALVLPIPVCVSMPKPGDDSPVQILVATVPPGLPNVYSLDGRYLGREGAQNNPLSPRRLRHLLMERGLAHFETRSPLEASLADLDSSQVAAYLNALHLPIDEPPEEVLARRGCLQRLEGELRPTYAALLLFGCRPQQWLPGATILAARFPGPVFSDQFTKQELTGTLPDQLRQAQAFLRANLRTQARLVGLTRQETLEYPFEAVRELLVNAVAHRDYNQQGDLIHLNIFSDRLEVQSPGRLPGPVTVENLLEMRFSRNAVITQVLADLGFVERLGYGLDRVVAVMRQHNLRPPRFEELGGSFRVTLYGSGDLAGDSALAADLSTYACLELNPRQQVALIFLVRHGRITSHDYQSLCPEVHAETLRRDLSDLVSRGALLKVGDKKATYYILK